MINQFFETMKKEVQIIGMVHYPPLAGYTDHPGIEVCTQTAAQDTETLRNGGVDAIMVENNYDIPHKEFLASETSEMMIKLTKTVRQCTALPLGVSVLWNDYRTAFLTALAARGSFIRVPVFVDSVRTQYGDFLADPKKVLEAREELGAQEIAIFADIHVKHAEMLEEKTLTQSAVEALEAGADGIIITGKWTGDAPKLDDLEEARTAVGPGFPILVGSGATVENVGFLMPYVNAIIVGTAIKSGVSRSKEQEINLKPWEERIDLARTKMFMQTVRGIKKTASTFVETV